MPRPTLAALAACLLCATPALAEEGEHAIALTPRYAVAVPSGGGEDLHGVGLGVGWEWGIDDFWGLVAEGSWSHHFGSGADLDVALALAGIRYSIDAFEWVPHLDLLVGGALLAPGGGAAEGDFAIAGGGGLDWRPARGFSIGIEGRYHAFVTRLDAIPAYVTAGARIVLYLP